MITDHQSKYITHNILCKWSDIKLKGEQSGITMNIHVYTYTTYGHHVGAETHSFMLTGTLNYEYTVRIPPYLLSSKVFRPAYGNSQPARCCPNYRVKQQLSSEIVQPLINA